jgi:hypothetical protein
MRRHEALNVADELLEEAGAFTGRGLERLADRAAQHCIGRRDEDA